MSQFRLVILDYTKKQLDNPIAQKVLSDVLFVKQQNFLRTDPQYVVMDKHDMIGTHYLIYDTAELLNPKLIFAIRTTYLDRAREHKIETPLMSLLPGLERPLQDTFKSFHATHEKIVDCNAWFVDPGYSKKNSGLNLSDLGYFLVCMNVQRFGFNNIVGCTNETYNASRWLENVGNMAPGLNFEHPVVKCIHKMLLVDQFNMQHFARVYRENQSLIEGTYEVFPQDEKASLSFAEYTKDLFMNSTSSGVLEAA